MLGKIVGGAIGFFVGGPLGAAAGAAIGAGIDGDFDQKESHKNTGQKTSSHQFDQKKSHKNIGQKTSSHQFNLVGMSYDNRQQFVNQLKVGHNVYLKREPNNPHDANAIEVYNSNLQMLGHVPRGIAAYLAGQLQTETLYYGNVTQAQGSSGVNHNIQITTRLKRVPDAKVNHGSEHTPVTSPQNQHLETSYESCSHVGYNHQDYDFEDYDFEDGQFDDFYVDDSQDQYNDYIEYKKDYLEYVYDMNNDDTDDSYYGIDDDPTDCSFHHDWGQDDAAD
jgi:hypothetical protein